MAKVGLSANFGVLVFKASLLYHPGGVHLPKYVCLPSFVYQYSRHLCSINGGPSAKVGSSAKLGVLVFKASLLYYLGVSICQSMLVCQVWCSSIQGIYSQFMGGPLAKVGLSANFGVLVFKASLLYHPGGSIYQSMFVCQVLCTNIQGIYALLMGVHQPK